MFAEAVSRSVMRGIAAAALLVSASGSGAIAQDAEIRGLHAQSDAPQIASESARVYPAIQRTAPLRLGVVEAFGAPERATELSVEFQRVIFDWSTIQRHGPGEWNFGWLNLEFARQQRAAGRPLIGLFMSVPHWASGTDDPKSPPQGLDLAPDDPRNLWATWVRAVVTRYADAIDTWIIWNEPDIWSDHNHGQQWSGTIEQYARMLKVAYISAKQANPRATILLSGLTYWWDASYGREQYFSRLLRLMDRDPSASINGWYFDGAVLQLYNHPRSLFDVPRVFHNLMMLHGFDKPVWINETNVVPWDDPVAPLTRAHFRATQEEQASYFVQAMAYALVGDVDRFEVYKMVDDAPILKGVEQAFGIVRSDATHSARPVFATLGVLSRELTQTTRSQLIDDGPVTRIYLEQPSLGRRITVIWNNSNEPREQTVAALGRSAQAMDKYGRVTQLRFDDSGFIHMLLPPATANTIPGSPDEFYIGGEPIMVVEPLPENYQPFTPTVDPFALSGREPSG